MKKRLNINVEHCQIRGGAPALIPLVQEIDRIVQDIAEQTETIKGIMFKYASLDSSEQYKKACFEVHTLSEKLYDASETINDMQRQIVEYHDSIEAFEESRRFGCSVRPHNVKKVDVSVNTTTIIIHKEDMEFVNGNLKKYTEDTNSSMRMLKNKKDEIGSIWNDPQYRDFSDFIDETVSAAAVHIRALEEYSDHLAQQIKILNNRG